MKLRAVGRRYGGPGSPWVLRGVDAVLPEATVLRVTGDNGSGKSTLLRLLAGIDAPSQGSVTDRPHPVGYVPERFPVALPFGPLGYLTHQARIRGMRRRAAARTAREWLERFGAGSHTHTPMAELSKGSSQKVAIAQALLVRPRLLVLDEAWTGLDSAAREELDRVVVETAATGGTVVYVDHHAERLAGSVGRSWRVTEGEVHDEQAGGEGQDGVPAGPRVRITVTGPPGAELPPNLPGAPSSVPGSEGELLLAVPTAASDALLRALLGARPPWHVRSVRQPEPDPESGAWAAEEVADGREPVAVPAPEPAPESGPASGPERRPGAKEQQPGTGDTEPPRYLASAPDAKPPRKAGSARTPVPSESEAPSEGAVPPGGTA